jgi:Zn-dependent protease with chaperone function
VGLERGGRIGRIRGRNRGGAGQGHASAVFYILVVAFVDLSFSRYVAARKGAASARAREGAHYAYGADLRVRAALDKLRPVTLAVEATLRFWHGVGKNRLLGNAVRVGERQFPAIHALVRRCAETLQIPEPTVYVTPQLATLGAHTFGAADDASIVLHSALVDHLSETELLFVIGHESGHIHNGHTVYLTTLYYLTQSANLIVRFGAQPAILALNAWSRRAEITCDRAGLLCTRDLAVATSALVKLAVGSQKLYSDINTEEYLRQLDEGSAGPGRFDELLARHPYLPKRVQALRIFAQTSFYRGAAGGPEAAPALSKEECDAKVGELLAVLR